MIRMTLRSLVSMNDRHVNPIDAGMLATPMNRSAQSKPSSLAQMDANRGKLAIVGRCRHPLRVGIPPWSNSSSGRIRAPIVLIGHDERALSPPGSAANALIPFCDGSGKGDRTGSCAMAQHHPSVICLAASPTGVAGTCQHALDLRRFLSVFAHRGRNSSPAQLAKMQPDSCGADSRRSRPRHSPIDAGHAMPTFEVRPGFASRMSKPPVPIMKPGSVGRQCFGSGSCCAQVRPTDLAWVHSR